MFDPKTKGETSHPTHSKSEFANTEQILAQTNLVHQEDKETIEHEFELIDLEAEDQTSIMQQTIKDKDH